MKEDKILFEEEKTYFGLKVIAYITGNSDKYYKSFPWRFKIFFNNKWVHFCGIPNYVGTKAQALKRAWYRAKIMHENFSEQ